MYILAMHIPLHATIADEKLSRYLLVSRPLDDKSRFLAKAGFVASNPQVLKAAIRELASRVPAVQDGLNEYGVFWRNEGTLRGPLADVMIVAIWLQWQSDSSFHFVTLKPWRE